MNAKGWMLSAGLGAAAGAVAVLMMPRQNPVRRVAAKAANKLLMLDGVAASFALVRVGEKVHISARSQGEINVQLILEKLNGGGHFDAAAAQISGVSMAKTMEMLRDAIDAYLDA